MSHEPGRERHMIRTCEECHAAKPLEYYNFYGGYLCEDCSDRLINEVLDEEAKNHADDQ